MPLRYPLCSSRTSAVALSLLVVFPSHAQTLAAIRGTVRDASSAAIANVLVSARNTDTGLERSTRSGSVGNYVLLSLPPGRYTLRAEKESFRRQIREGIRLDEGARIDVDFVLEIGPLRQQVTVSAPAPPLSASMDETAGLVGERQLRDLPLNGRSYDNLLTLNPGIVNYTSQKTGSIGVSNSAVANAFAVEGRRPQENLFLIDGVEYTGSAEINMTPGGASGLLLGVDAVREFNVVADTYSANYGKRPGAQVSVITQPGTNNWHGTLYDFVRNSFFDARNFFDQGPVPNFGRNQFGASLGGPIQHDRTFFFMNYEGFRQHLGLSDVTLVPDNNARQGFLPGPEGTLVNIGLAPGVANLLQFWPVQNGPELGSGIAEAFSSPVQHIREDFGVARLDRIFSSRDALNFSYTVDDSADHTPTANPLSLDVESLRNQVAALHETHVFSAGLLNDLIIGFSRASYFYTGEPTVSGPGFVAGRPMSALVIGGSASPNTPTQITLAGSNNGSNLFATRNLFTYADTLSGVHGIHQWSAGVWFQRVQSNDRLALGQYGQATFTSLTAFLQGTVGTFTTVPTPTPLGWRSLEGAWFAEDSMRVSSRLTVSLGLRHEFTSGWNESHDRAGNFFFDSNGILQTQPHVGSSVFAANNAKWLFQPRAGLAWDVFGNSRTILRAGAGLYASLQDALSYRLDQNAPFNTSIALHNVPVSALNVVPGAPLPAGVVVSPAGVDPNLTTPMVATYSLRIEQEIAPQTTFTLGYAGSHGYHEIISADLNEPFPAICPAAPCPASLPSGAYYYSTEAPLANPQLGSTWTWISQGVSSYNALQLDLNRRFANGFSVRGIYTWSKALDDGDTLNASAAANAPGLAMETRNLRLDWGLATFDARHTASIALDYELPFARHNRWLGRWGLESIFSARAGFPFTPELSFNPSNNGNTQNPVRPSWNPAFQGPVILGQPNEYFNPNAFVVGPSGSYGNVARNALIGPALGEWDLALRKEIAIRDQLHAEFRAEAFNLLNHANFNTPNIVVFTVASGPPSAAAGVITSTATTSRQIQLAVKLVW